MYCPRKFPDNFDVICLVLMAISMWDVGVLRVMNNVRVIILLTYLLLPKLEFVPNSRYLRSNKLLMARDPIHD